MPFVLGRRSRDNLEGVHPDLKRVVERAIEITTVDFTVLDGMRTECEERKLVASGASTTNHSRHLPNTQGYACAVDVGAWVDGKVDWTWKFYESIAVSFKEAARSLGIPIEWGGDWETFKDGGHFQLPWADYP